MLTAISCSTNRHINTNIGYKITGPQGWRRSSGLTFDDDSVTFKKPGGDDASSIKVLVDHSLYGSPLISAKNQLSGLVARMVPRQRDALRIVD